MLTKLQPCGFHRIIISKTRTASCQWALQTPQSRNHLVRTCSFGLSSLFSSHALIWWHCQLLLDFSFSHQASSAFSVFTHDLQVRGPWVAPISFASQVAFQFLSHGFKDNPDAHDFPSTSSARSLLPLTKLYPQCALHLALWKYMEVGISTNVSFCLAAFSWESGTQRTVACYLIAQQ